MNRPPRSPIGPRAACAAATASIVSPVDRHDCSWSHRSATHAPDRDCGGTARDDAEVGGVVHAFEYDDSPRVLEHRRRIGFGPAHEAGQHAAMQLVASDTSQYRWRGRVDDDALADRERKRSGSPGIDEDGGQSIAGSQRAVDNEVALADEHPGHVATGLLAFSAQLVVAQSDERSYAGIGG